MLACGVSLFQLIIKTTNDMKTLKQKWQSLPKEDKPYWVLIAIAIIYFTYQIIGGLLS